MIEQYLQAHVVDNGFPAGAKEYQARVHALGLPIWALVEEIYAAILLLLQPAHHTDSWCTSVLGRDVLECSGTARKMCPTFDSCSS